MDARLWNIGVKVEDVKAEADYFVALGAVLRIHETLATPDGTFEYALLDFAGTRLFLTPVTVFDDRLAVPSRWPDPCGLRGLPTSMPNWSGSWRSAPRCSSRRSRSAPRSARAASPLPLARRPGLRGAADPQVAGLTTQNRRPCATVRVPFTVRGARAMSDLTVSFLFDLDGTLVDSVYQHVLAWKEALQAEGIELSVWRIHRRIGMSGGLFTNQLLRETGLDIDARADRAAAAAPRGGLQAALAHQVRPLPGARELLAWLTDAGIPWAIATSGRMETARPNLETLGVDPAEAPVVTRDQVRYAKPDPDLFLAAAAAARRADRDSACVVGDSDLGHAGGHAAPAALGVGLLSRRLRRGGAGQGRRLSGSIEDPADLLAPHRRGRRPALRQSLSRYPRSLPLSRRRCAGRAPPP